MGMSNSKPNSKTMELYEYVPTSPPKGWKRKMGLCGWVGNTLYIPARAAGLSDQEALLCLGYDGAPFYFAGNVLLVTEEWARRENPARSDVYDIMHERAVEMRTKGQAPARSGVLAI
jgi:hypothetical protein